MNQNACIRVVLLTLMCTTATTARADGVSSVLVEADRITILVPIAVVGGSEGVLERWRNGIDRAWNRGNDGRPFRVCDRPVHFDAQFTRRAGSHAAAGHVVFVADVLPGQRYVSTVSHAPGTSPAESARTGYWGSNLTAATAAHEFGHLLGLPDEYTEEDPNRNGLRDPGEGSVPDVERYPDAWLSLMAFERGIVLQRHVREILRLHGVSGLRDCAM